MCVCVYLLGRVVQAGWVEDERWEIEKKKVKRKEEKKNLWINISSASVFLFFQLPQFILYSEPSSSLFSSSVHISTLLEAVDSIYRCVHPSATV